MQPDLYTVADIEKAGSILNDVIVVSMMEDMLRAQSVYTLLLPPLPPITRRQRIVGRLHDYRWRIKDAVAMLRGTHDCGC